MEEKENELVEEFDFEKTTQSGRPSERRGRPGTLYDIWKKRGSPGSAGGTGLPATEDTV